MKIDIRKAGKDGKITIVDLNGEIDTVNVAAFKEAISTLLEQGQYNVVLNFKGVNYINSVGIGVVASALKRILEHKGELKILSINSDIREIFELIKFTKILKIYDVEQEAVESFAL